MTVSEMLSGPFTRRLSALRGKRSKAEFAQFLGLKPPTYFRYEAGRLPKPETLRSIAALCGVTVDWLLGREPLEKTLNIHEGRDTTAGAGNVTLRESPGPEWDVAPRQTQTPCRYPADCDLPARLNRLEKNLADINALLVSLLAEERSRNTPAASPDVKAG